MIILAVSTYFSTTTNSLLLNDGGTGTIEMWASSSAKRANYQLSLDGLRTQVLESVLRITSPENGCPDTVEAWSVRIERFAQNKKPRTRRGFSLLIKKL
jgi:hypothetical protein